MEDQEERKRVQGRYNAEQNALARNLKILMTTSAGSEGISLGNTREVHIIEPYWNRVRIDQVIGRARRVNSHLFLPPEQHKVTVFEYATTFPEYVLKKNYNEDPGSLFIEFLNNSGGFISGDDEEGQDKKKKTNEYYEYSWKTYQKKLNSILIFDKNNTSDEHLYRIGQEKFQVNRSFLQLVKNVAIDCLLNYEDNRNAGIQQQGENYENIDCFGRDEEYTLKEIASLNEDDRYSFPLELVQEEMNVQRKKKFTKTNNKVGYSYNLPSKVYLLGKNRKNIEIEKWRIVNEKFRVVKLKQDTLLLNFYRYYGLDPTFVSFYDSSLRGNALIENHLDALKLGSCKDDVELDIRSVKVTLNDMEFMYQIKLNQYIERAWVYLKSKNKVTGTLNFTEENLEMIRKLISLKDMNSFPFHFKAQDRIHYMADFKNTNLSDKKNQLSRFLFLETKKLKLQFIKQQQQRKQIITEDVVKKLKPKTKNRRRRGQ